MAQTPNNCINYILYTTLEHWMYIFHITSENLIWYMIVEERSQQYNFFSREIFHLYRHHQTLLFCTMYYTSMYYILYNTINVKYLKTYSGLQDQRSADADYNLIDSVLLLYSSLVLIVGSSSWIHSASAYMIIVYIPYWVTVVVLHLVG